MDVVMFSFVVNILLLLLETLPGPPPKVNLPRIKVNLWLVYFSYRLLL
jgi:hypothetical protein